MLEPGHRPLCWAVSDDKAGNRIQAQGLIEALGFDPVSVLVRPRAPWSWLPARLSPERAALRGTRDGVPLQPPWPDLAVGVGHKAGLPLLAIRAASARAAGRGGKPTFVIQVQRPILPAERFDLVVVPRHDVLSGPNVISLLGSIHRVTKPRLAAAEAALAPRLAGLPRRRIAVLLGGRSKVYDFDVAQARRLGRQLAALARSEQATLMITPSRRSDPAATEALLRQLDAVPHFAWDGQGENPYYGILASAEAAVVTADSVNMVSEAAAAGLPVLVVRLSGGSAKFDRFHDEMRAAGHTRPFRGCLESWRVSPFDEMGPLASTVLDRLPFTPELAGAV
ncbi:MAG: mitochondrial fission ELM1 family protein [Pseudomonadota bacterium]